MNDLAFIVDGRLDDLTGGQLFNRYVVEGLRQRGRPVQVCELADPGSREQITQLPPGSSAVLDEVALPALADDIPALARRLRLIALVHHPLSEEYGSPAAELQRLAKLEQHALPLFRGVLVPSRRTARAVVALGVPDNRIAITPPGIAKPGHLPPPRSAPVRRLLYVANVIPRKGHDLLIEALGRICDLDWELECIGLLDRDPAYARRVVAQIAASGLRGRVRLSGAKLPAEVEQAYAVADAFVSSSLHEGYGMAWAEAMAWGLPQVTTTAGAVADVVPAAAGLLVPPNDCEALAAALRRLIEEPGLAASLAAGARAAATHLPDWPQAVAEWEAAFDRLAGLSRGLPPDR